MYKGSCRLCLSEDGVVNIFEDSKDNASTMITRCCPIEVLEDDGLPQKICAICLNALADCDKFLSKCVESDRLLREQGTVSLKTGIIKIEPYDVASLLKEDVFNSNETQPDFLPVEFETEDRKVFKDEEIHMGMDYDDYSGMENEECHSEDITETKNDVIKPSTKVECDICGKMVIQRNLQNHMNSHLQRFPCEVCLKTFKTQSYVVNHYARAHPNETFTCDTCKRMFINKDSLITHVQSMHTSKSFPCDICCKKFNNAKCLRKHLKTKRHKLVLQEGGKSLYVQMKKKQKKSRRTQRYTEKEKYNPVVCDVCGKTYNRSNIKAHMETHTTERKFSCDICKRTFKVFQCLQRHMEIHGNKTYECDICKKDYNTRRAMMGHRRTVHSVRVFKCDLCDKICNSNFWLKRHKMTHTGERPYACKFCDSRFALWRSLHEHERLHLGITPYKCPSCPKAFTQLGNMKSHFKYNHRDIVFSEVYKPTPRHHRSIEYLMKKAKEAEDKQDASLDKP